MKDDRVCEVPEIPPFAPPFMEEFASVYFTREPGGEVGADVDLGLDIRVVLYSQEPTSPREWEIDSIEVVHDGGTMSFDRRRGQQMAGGKLLAFLTREWDRNVAVEARTGRAKADRAFPEKVGGDDHG